MVEGTRIVSKYQIEKTPFDLLRFLGVPRVGKARYRKGHPNWTTPLYDLLSFIARRRRYASQRAVRQMV